MITPPAPRRLLEAAAATRGLAGIASDELPDTLREELVGALHEYVDALRDGALDVVGSIRAVKSALADVPAWLREQSVTQCIERHYRTR